MKWVLAAGLLLIGCNGDKDQGDDGTTDKTGDTGTTPSAGELTVLGDATNLPPAAILSIWGSSDTDVWMVGSDDGTGPVVLHWDGSAWSRIETGSTGDLWWVSSPGGDIVYMSGEGGRMLTYSRSAGTFTEEVITNAAYKLFGNWGTSDTDMYAVGGDIQGNLDGVILHNDGTGWTEVATTPVAPDGIGKRQAFKIWGSATDDVWVVGTRALVMHWDGATWEHVPEPLYSSTPLTTVAGSGPDDVWAVGGFGNAAVAHFDGTGWVDDSPPPASVAPFFNGVTASAQHGVAACGGNGSIFWRTSTEWAPDPRPRATARDFHACWIDDKGAIWAVGGDLTGLSEGSVVYGGESVPPISL